MEEALEMAMKTTMQTLDTKDPELDRLVFAVVDKKNPKDEFVQFRYLTKDQKQDLVSKCKAKEWL